MVVSAGERVWNVSSGVTAMPREAEKLIRGGWVDESVLGRVRLWSFLVGLCCTLDRMDQYYRPGRIRSPYHF